MDLDVGENVEEGTENTTVRVATSNLALPDNADLTINEAGTKLDLARAYLDMGDPDGARGILEEVIQEGNEGQQEDARQMLESLNG
jgi:pilus assembly protein FimV